MRQSAEAFRQVFANPSLRRIQLAWAGSNIGGWAYTIAIAIYAFQQDGAYAVGLIALVRWVVSGVAAPFTGVLGDRFSRVRVMVVSDVVRVGILTGVGALVMAGAEPLLVYGLSIVGTIVGTAFRPAQAALVPAVARTPTELTASNATASTIESTGIFLGPALGGVLVAAFGVEFAFFFTAGLLAWSAVLIGLVPEPVREVEEAAEPEGMMREAFGGFRVLVSERRLALLAGLFALQTFVDGALAVLVVVIALETLDLGASWVGFLNSAAGIGGIAATNPPAMLVARNKLGTDFGGGLFVWGAPLVLLGLWTEPWLALVALALTGVGNTVVDVAGDTLLQRAVPERVLARAFGAAESLMLVTVALGSIAVPVLLDLIGDRATLMAVGALLPLAVAFSWRALAALDSAAVPEGELEALRALPLFAPLDPPTLEHLASRLQEREVPAGEVVFRQGELGDRFYVVLDGRVGVSVDGVEAQPLGPGDSFGEIALLHDVPRTATVTALEHTRLYALERDDFVAAVTGHPESAAAAEEVVGSRLNALRPAVGAVGPAA